MVNDDLLSDQRRTAYFLCRSGTWRYADSQPGANLQQNKHKLIYMYWRVWMEWPSNATFWPSLLTCPTVTQTPTLTDHCPLLCPHSDQRVASCPPPSHTDHPLTTEVTSVGGTCPVMFVLSRDDVTGQCEHGTPRDNVDVNSPVYLHPCVKVQIPPDSYTLNLCLHYTLATRQSPPTTVHRCVVTWCVVLLSSVGVFDVHCLVINVNPWPVVSGSPVGDDNDGRYLVIMSSYRHDIMSSIVI